MNITIHSVAHGADDLGNRFLVAKFTANGCAYEKALNDQALDRSSIDLDNDTCDAVDEAISTFMLDRGVDPEPYDIDELTSQAVRLGYLQGKRYVLDELGRGIELIENLERGRQRVRAFYTRAEAALWLREQLDDKGLEKGPVKRVNANIPEALHDDFKALCVRRKVDMQDVLARLIIEWMNNQIPSLE